MSIVWRDWPKLLRGRDAYAWERFSSGPQKKGFTLDRQRELRDAAVAEFGLNLIDTRTAAAVSAFRGLQRAEGSALDALIKMGEHRLIEPGTPLLVEAWDRLSREVWMEGVGTVLRIHKAGWLIITCNDQRVWDADALNAAGPFLGGVLHAAHTDSVRRKEGVSHAWGRKRNAALAEGVPLTRHVPGWLRLEPKPGFSPDAKPKNCKPIPQRKQVAVLVEIFRWYASGLYCDEITSRLNRLKRPMVGRSVEDKRPADRAWRASRVSKLLNDKRVRGYLAVEGPDGRKVEARIYPQVISDELWTEVRRIADGRTKHTGNRGHAHANLFTKLAYCVCGATLTVRAGGRPRPGAIVRGTSHPRHWWNVLQCSASVNGRGCERDARFLLREWEPRFLDAVALSPPPMPEQTAADAETAGLREALAALEIEIDESQTSLDGTLALTARSPSAKAAWEKNSQELDKKRRKHDRLKAEIAATAGRAGDGARSSLDDLTRAAVEDHDTAARGRVRSLLPQVVDRIQATDAGGFEMWFKDGLGVLFAADGEATRVVARAKMWRDLLTGELPEGFILAPHHGGRVPPPWR